MLAQSDSTGIMYFQYDSAGAPIGFVYNDVQYLYITNISGDIIGITDAQGNPIAEYIYDAWGKLLDITTAEENNEEQLSLANANPLRYRGYYYDNETGYYYLQSRYYNPEWGRFISADSFAYLDTQNSFSLNAYIYCWNCPTIFEDAEGTTPKISIDIEKIFSFISNTNEKISVRLQEGLQKFSEGIDRLKARFIDFGEKIKFYFNNPDVFINDTLSKRSGRRVNIDFNPISRIKNFFDPTMHMDFPMLRKEEKGSAVTQLGSEVAEIMSTILLSWDAFLKGGKNFACLIALEILRNKSILYQSGENEKERRANFLNWYNDSFNKFTELTKTTFYALVNRLSPEFFIDFFEEVSKSKDNTASITLAGFITITFGLGDGTDYFSAILDALNGEYEVLNTGNSSSGIVIRNKTFGAFLQVIFDSMNGTYFGSIKINVEIDWNNMPPPESFEYAVETVGKVGTIGAVIVMILKFVLSILSGGVLQPA